MTKSKSALLCVALLLALGEVVLIAGCERREPMLEISGMAMGTQYTAKLPGDIDEHDRIILRNEIEALLDALEDMMSNWRIDSEISRFNATLSTDWQPVSIEFCSSVAEALELSELTNGAFDITVGPLVDLWGFGPGDIIDSPPPDTRIEAVRTVVGYVNLEADCVRPALRKRIPELVLDMSAFGKGYAADHVGGLLDALGFKHYLIDIGGELRLRGRNPEGVPWAIGIEAPLPDRRSPHTVLHMTNTAVATSGDYRNFFEHDGKLYSHTIDSRTGRPVTHTLASVTVVDANGARADALATALLVLGPEQGMALATRLDLAVLFLQRDGGKIEERMSPAFEKRWAVR